MINDKEFFKHYSLEYNKLKKEVEDFLNNKEKIKEELIEESSLFPKPDKYRYLLMLYSGLQKYPLRFKNYVIAKSQKASKVIEHLPTILDIEPISRCNFSCIMCQVRDWEKNKRADDMNFEDFKTLVDSQYGLTEVKLQGIGEPLMHKEFFKMLEYLIQKDIWVRTTINGSMLHKNESYKKIVDSNIGEVQISFDGATKEVFERIRVNSNFEQVVENVTLLNEYSNEKNRLITRMWVLVQNYNQHQIKEFIEIAKQMKFKRMTFSIGISDWGQDQFRSDSLQVKDKSRENIINEIMSLRKENSELDITFWDLQDKYNKNNICQWPFNRAFVGSDMRITPCCMIGNPDIKSLGSAFEFTQNWNNKSYQEFRQCHLDDDIPEICKNCYEEVNDEK